MKKIYISAAVFLLFSLFLSGCGNERPGAFAGASASFSEGPVSPEETDAPGEAEDMEATISRYKELYGTVFTFRDLFVPQRVILIGGAYMVDLLYIPGCEQVKAIPRDAIARVEYDRFDTFMVVKFYDKTNQCISVSLEPEYAYALLANFQ